jgi:transposase-like protein
LSSAFEEGRTLTTPSAARPLRPLLAAAEEHVGQGAPRRAARQRRRGKATLRAEAVLALYVDEGLTYTEIAARVGVSRQRVHQVIDAALKEAAGRARELAVFALDRELLLIESTIREAAEILLRKCEACAGDEERRVRCKTCSGTGHAYPVMRRLRAIDRIGRAQDRRIKLLGLDQQGHMRASR